MDDATAEKALSGIEFFQPKHKQEIEELKVKFGPASAVEIIQNDKVKNLLIEVNKIPKTPAGDAAGVTLSRLLTGHPELVDQLQRNLTDKSAADIVAAATRDPASLDKALPKLLNAKTPSDFSTIASTITNAPTQSFAKANPPSPPGPEAPPAVHHQHPHVKTVSEPTTEQPTVLPAVQVNPSSSTTANPQPPSGTGTGGKPATDSGMNPMMMLASFATRPGFKDFMEQKLGLKLNDDEKLVANPAADPKFADLRNSLGIDKLTSGDEKASGAQLEKLKPLLTKINEKVDEDPDFFNKMNTMMNNHPQAASMFAGMMQDHPDMAMAGMDMMGKFDNFHTMISGLFSKAEPGSFLGMIGSFVERIFSGVMNFVEGGGLGSLLGGPSSGNGGGLINMLMAGNESTPASGPAAAPQRNAAPAATPA